MSYIRTSLAAHSLVVAVLLVLPACGHKADEGSDRGSAAADRSDASLLHTCGGTEPFWSLSISQSGLSFEMGDEAFEMAGVETVSAVSGGGEVLHTKNAVTGAEVSISLLAGECNDGMSENIYRHHVLLRDDNRVLYGCCDVVGQGPTETLPQVAATKEHSCSGTEPFWSLKIAASGITLSDPYLEKDLQMPGAEPVSVAGMAEDFSMVYRTQDPESGAPVAISLIKGLCNDGMSEAEYAYNVLVEKGSEILLVGCCDEIKKETDCRVTGCPSDRQCMLCKTGPNTTGNICIPKGAMC